MSTSTTTTEPKRTRKLCVFSIREGCKLGAACPNDHPLDPLEIENAKFEFAEKKTLNLCGFHPVCTRPDCTFLHVTPVPKAAAPPPARAPPAGKTPPRTPPAGKTPPRTPPAGKTPPRTPATATARAGPSQAKAGARESGAPRGRPRQGAALKEGPREELESLRALHRIRGKINALERSRLAFETLAEAVRSAEAREKADKVQEMHDSILEQLTQFAGSIDEYLLLLGASADPEEAPASDEEAPASDEEAPASDEEVLLG